MMVEPSCVCTAIADHRVHVHHVLNTVPWKRPSGSRWDASPLQPLFSLLSPGRLRRRKHNIANPHGNYAPRRRRTRRCAAKSAVTWISPQPVRPSARQQPVRRRADAAREHRRRARVLQPRPHVQRNQLPDPPLCSTARAAGQPSPEPFCAGLFWSAANAGYQHRTFAPATLAVRLWASSISAPTLCGKLTSGRSASARADVRRHPNAQEQVERKHQRHSASPPHFPSEIGVAFRLFILYNNISR